MKRSSLKRISSKRKSQLEDEKEKTHEMYQFFINLWNNTPPYKRRCYETGVALKNPPLSTYFHHVLPKSKYPQYRLCAWNIVFLQPEVHNQAEIDLDKTPRVKEYKERLINQINNL